MTEKQTSKEVVFSILNPMGNPPLVERKAHRLEQNRLNSKRNGKRDYLLRGMIHYEGNNLGYYGKDIRGKSWAYRYFPSG